MSKSIFLSLWLILLLPLVGLFTELFPTSSALGGAVIAAAAGTEDVNIKKDEGNGNDSDSEQQQEEEYREFFDMDHFNYWPEEFESGIPQYACGYKGSDPNRCYHPGQLILSDYVVAGVNLAGWKMSHPKFKLFEDFDIGPLLRLNEGWKDLLRIRSNLERPSLSWYVDKVARKRWLKEQGYPQPKFFFLKYKSELSTTGEKDEAETILNNLPTDRGFCAKPTHMSMTMGNWLVDLDPNQKDVKFTRFAKQLNSHEKFNPAECADSLAEGLQREAATIESWALKNVEPGIVVEDLWSDHTDRSMPPQEFCIFVVWGRVYVAVWNEVGEDRYLNGFFYRDGTPTVGCPYQQPIPEWVPWKELVEIAEQLGANKDMFRVDIFVGVPRYFQGDKDEVFIAVSESEIHPTTIFCNPFIADEMARLWVAGYKIGNYEVVPNTEVPKEYIEKQKLRSNFTNGSTDGSRKDEL
jgi:hypothetical protein